MSLVLKIISSSARVVNEGEANKSNYLKSALTVLESSYNMGFPVICPAPVLTLEFARLYLFSRSALQTYYILP